MKKGFTLVELLAVIVILAIILAIAIPSISNMIKNASRSSLESSAKMVLKAINYKMLEDSAFDPSTINETTVKSVLNIDNSNYETLTVKQINGNVYVTIAGTNKWANLTVSGTKTIVRVEDTVTSFVRGANAPVLATGMTPIKWNGSAWVTTTETDTAWYNYDTTNKIWANAQTADGSMWVWIPRYIYKIPTANWHTSTAGSIQIQFTKGVDDNWNKASIGAIDLGETANASNNKWTNHPAFTFGDTELAGIWVMKFEASGTTTAPASKPNVSSTGASIGNAFTATRNMETNSTYGWGTTGNDLDTHLIKNSEWGAVAYLAQSTYGKNSEVWINNSNPVTTGCSGSSVSAATYAGCEYAYNTAIGANASTTGNIYGIYDMSGCAWEFVSAYINNGDSNLATYGNSLINADIKYRDAYSVSSMDTAASNFLLAINKKGDAVYETSLSTASSTSWYNDGSNLFNTNVPFMIRSSGFSSGSAAGIFYYANSSGIGNSFRATIAIAPNL